MDHNCANFLAAPPKFGRSGTLEYEVIEGRGITMDCQIEASPRPVFSWLKVFRFSHKKPMARIIL